MSYNSLIIAVGGVKGGVGKSTVTWNLGCEWMHRGLRTLLIDADPQGTTLTAANVAAEAGVAAPNVVAVGDNIRSAVPELAANADVTIIDTAGRLGKRFAGALMVADIAILPCRPNPADIWALADTTEAVQQAQSLREELLAYVVINGLEARTALSRDARDNIKAAGLPVLKTQLCQRIAFAETCATGKGVTAYQPKSPAAQELRALVDEIETVTGRRHDRKMKKGRVA